MTNAFIYQTKNKINKQINKDLLKHAGRKSNPHKEGKESGWPQTFPQSHPTPEGNRATPHSFQEENRTGNIKTSHPGAPPKLRVTGSLPHKAQGAQQP